MNNSPAMYVRTLPTLDFFLFALMDCFSAIRAAYDVGWNFICVVYTKYSAWYDQQRQSARNGLCAMLCMLPSTNISGSSGDWSRFTRS